MVKPSSAESAIAMVTPARGSTADIPARKATEHTPMATVRPFRRPFRKKSVIAPQPSRPITLDVCATP